ncbi:hypothetical protein [Anaerosporobacter faecicola]|uniref:hypothetical protein n=1 Tax=Anaerosporobacter faecicola TaxID=2718714 RepID=UPI00143B8AB7|nr:hypothetical protein [Anaerosporobacter faecicola]
MFSVNLSKFPERIQEIRDNAIQLSKFQDRMEQCQSVLHSLSGMEEIIEQMRILGQQLDEEKRSFVQLADTLAEVKKYYEHCERKIEEQYEQGEVSYQKLKTGFRNIDNIDSFFQEIENR